MSDEDNNTIQTSMMEQMMAMLKADMNNINDRVGSL